MWNDYHKFVTYLLTELVFVCVLRTPQIHFLISKFLIHKTVYNINYNHHVVGLFLTKITMVDPQNLLILWVKFCAFEQYSPFPSNRPQPLATSILFCFYEFGFLGSSYIGEIYSVCFSMCGFYILYVLLYFIIQDMKKIKGTWKGVIVLDLCKEKSWKKYCVSTLCIEQVILLRKQSPVCLVEPKIFYITN